MTVSADELAAFRSAHPDIEAVQLFLTDPSGVPRGKTATLHELERLYADGRPVAGSILGLDITGRDVEATGLVWETGDADLLCRPVAGTLRPAPWLARPTAQLMLSMYTLAGAPAPADPRHVLAHAIERLRARGLRPVLAVELEFFVRPGTDEEWHRQWVEARVDWWVAQGVAREALELFHQPHWLSLRPPFLHHHYLLD